MSRIWELIEHISLLNSVKYNRFTNEQLRYQWKILINYITGSEKQWRTFVTNKSLKAKMTFQLAFSRWIYWGYVDLCSSMEFFYIEEIILPKTTSINSLSFAVVLLRYSAYRSKLTATGLPNKLFKVILHLVVSRKTTQSIRKASTLLTSYWTERAGERAIRSLFS